ncbi:MAG: conserved membrane protein of unknown function [Promethearchaeota archaeon]|nr:MAG: conserved membrane protein of unknown function [Candidatus Lokiarchaeota archaeon]
MIPKNIIDTLIKISLLFSLKEILIKYTLKISRLGIKIALSNIEFINGLFSLIFVAISLTVGIRMAFKYFKFNDKNLIYMGVGWIGITSPWWPSTTSFIYTLITGTGLNEFLYFSISMPLTPWFMVIFVLGITNLIQTKHQKIILPAYIILGILFEAFYLYSLFTNPSNIGTLESQIDVRYTGFTMIYLIINLFTILTLGIYFGKESLKATNPEINLKGKFLIVAFLFYFIGGFLDSSLPLNIVTLSLTRIILILGSFFFYNGFILPEWIKNRFIK